MSRMLFGFSLWFKTIAIAIVFASAVGSTACIADESDAVSQVGEESAALTSEVSQPKEAHKSGSLLTADPGAAIWNLLIFLSVFAILSKFAWPQILAGLKAREDQIRGDLEGADRANKEAKLLLSEYNQRLATSQSEIHSMLAQARKDAEISGQRIVEQAREEAENQKVRALADIESAKRSALAEMADQTTAAAVQMARQMIGRELKAEDHADVVRQALQGLPSKN